MKKIITCIVIIIAAITFEASGATTTVHGTVLTSKGKTPVVGAMVKDKSSDAFTTTDVDGNFTISVNEGSSLEISSLGYLSKSVKVKSDYIVVNLSTGKERNYKTFYTLVAGMEYINETFNDNMAAGLMLGMYWKKWGWFMKVAFPIGFKTDERDANVGGVLTIGGVKNITDNFRIYAGTGFGLCMYGYYNVYASGPDYGYYYQGTDKEFEWEKGNEAIGIPAEIGVQWNYKRLNLTAGFQYMFNIDPHPMARRSNMSPYLGIGYTW